jgi:hypothetical protein
MTTPPRMLSFGLNLTLGRGIFIAQRSVISAPPPVQAQNDSQAAIVKQRTGFDLVKDSNNFSLSRMSSPPADHIHWS